MLKESDINMNLIMKAIAADISDIDIDVEDPDNPEEVIERNTIDEDEDGDEE